MWFCDHAKAYEEAFEALFAALDKVDQHLTTHRYLAGNQITEADWRLFTTLVRFDAVYVGHFKCNRQRITDYPHLSGYLRELYQVPGIQETVDFTTLNAITISVIPRSTPLKLCQSGRKWIYSVHTSVNELVEKGR